MNPEAQTLRIVLQKEVPGQSWGFRMQGGSDFTTPLSVQMVNPGGLADRSGLMAGDAILQINNKATECVEHEEAKREILMCGESVVILVQRGAVKVWRPKVTPMSALRPDELPQGPDGEVYVQKTSLAANHSESPYANVGSSYNRAARPFAGFGGGGASSGQQPVAPPQYGGGTAFATSENSQQNYAAQQNRMTAGMTNQYQSGGVGAGGAPTGGPGKAPGGFRSVTAPTDKAPGEKQTGTYITCAVCGTLIAGVFVKIAGCPMHPECFKCCQCGKNLKNQGYFEISGQLYCDVHAQQAAQPPGPDMVAVPTYR